MTDGRRNTGKSIRNLLFPPKCPFCRKVTGDTRFMPCKECSDKIIPLKGRKMRTDGEFFDECISCLSYKDSVRESLHRYKFSGRRVYSHCYCEYLYNAAQSELAGKYDIITWIPISRKRRRTRGYDQSKLLATELADKCAVPCAELLRKNKNNPAQSSIGGKSERRANVLDAYTAVNECAGMRVLLIDDIVTTGSTLSEASRTLLMAGAESVVCLTVAKTAGNKQ